MEKVFHIHLVSDATGETINNILRACLVQFQDVVVEEHYWNLIRTKRQLDMVTEGLRQWPGAVFYTFVDEVLQNALVHECNKLGLNSVSVLNPVLHALAVHLGKDSTKDPGRQHSMDQSYFARIDAMDFALALDDGNQQDRINDADVLVLGVSRTSKTPTCLYLANRGIKAANIPLVPDIPIMPEIFKTKKALIVGLTKDYENLVEIRLNRLKSLQLDEKTAYVDQEKVKEEVLNARKLFNKLGCPVIDVTRRSIEETAAEIMMLLSKRALENEISKHAKSIIE